MNYLDKILELSKNGDDTTTKEILDLTTVNRGVFMKTILCVGLLFLVLIFLYLTTEFTHLNGVYNIKISGVVIMLPILLSLSIVYSIQLFKYRKKLKSYGITKIPN